MSNLYKTKNIVSIVLLENESARNDDNLLYKEVCKKIQPNIGRLCFDTVLNNMDRLKIPHFETVRRTRQKLQEENPEIYGCNIFVKKQREKKEKEFREFARS